MRLQIHDLLFMSYSATVGASKYVYAYRIIITNQLKNSLNLQMEFKYKLNSIHLLCSIRNFYATVYK